jgi:hypothetical protein
VGGQTNFDCRVVSSGIDWLTCTTRPPGNTLVMQLALERWLRQREQSGYQVKEWNWQGYSGWTTDGISFGDRPDGLIARLSGEVSALHGQSAITWADNVSRLDVQATVQDTDTSFDWAGYALDQAWLDKRVRAGITKTSEIRTTPSGHTAYIGSRISNRFFRVYDKHAESEGVYPKGSWRFEVEYKGDRAQLMARKLTGAMRIEEACRGVVEQAFLDYGITLPCRPIGANWKDTCPREMSTDARRLAYLEKNIRPLVARLLEAHDIRDVLGALGLSAYADVGYELAREEVNLE